MKTMFEREFEFGVNDDAALEDGRILANESGFVIEINGREVVSVKWEELADQLRASRYQEAQELADAMNADLKLDQPFTRDQQ